MMRRLDHYSDALRSQCFLYSDRYFRGKPFLDLETPCVGFHDPRQLGEPYDTPIWDISYPSFADDRRQMVFTMALERNAAQDDHLFIATGFIEGLVEDLMGVLV